MIRLDHVPFLFTRDSDIQEARHVIPVKGSHVHANSSPERADGTWLERGAIAVFVKVKG